jgi:hypothetical protein
MTALGGVGNQGGAPAASWCQAISIASQARSAWVRPLAPAPGQ